MSKYVFEEGQPIFDDTKFKSHAHLFNVVAVDKEGRATKVRLGPDANTFSESLSLATKLTGASSAWAAQDDHSIIELSHGYLPTSPYYTEERDYSPE